MAKETSKNNIQQAIDILIAARDAANDLLTDGLQIRSNHTLTQLINGLSHANGINSGGSTTAPDFAPITHIFGAKLEVESKQPVANAVPTSEELSDLQEQVKEAIPDFIISDAKALKGNYSDLIVRGVARAAGMDVTPTTPAKISLDFIRQVKAAVIEKDKQIKESKAADEAAGKLNELVEREVTEEDLLKIPYLAANGIKVGDKVKLPAKAETK